MTYSYFIAHILGKGGVLFFIGLIIFIATYKNSVRLFTWIEQQTYGTRTYILKKCELLHWEVKPERLTYLLLFMSFGIAFLVSIALIIFGFYFFALVAGVFISFVGWKIPRPTVDYFYELRIKKFQLQMVDALNLLANGIRAGLSLPQACGMIVDELPAPISEEFNLILQQNRVGVTIDECFSNLVTRVPTEDNQMFVSCIHILRETGGNLAETFDTITAVIRERVRLQQKIDTFTSLGKLQGTIIFCIPFGMLGMIWASNPDSVIAMFTSIIGILLLIVAFSLTLLGGYFMLKIVTIKT